MPNHRIAPVQKPDEECTYDQDISNDKKNNKIGSFHKKNLTFKVIQNGVELVQIPVISQVGSRTFRAICNWEGPGKYIVPYLYYRLRIENFYPCKNKKIPSVRVTESNYFRIFRQKISKTPLHLEEQFLRGLRQSPIRAGKLELQKVSALKCLLHALISACFAMSQGLPTNCSLFWLFALAHLENSGLPACTRSVRQPKFY
jgi:hypothetical protein